MNPPRDPLPYTGVENLEVMAEAQNYNSWLVRRIFEHARPGSAVLDFGAGSGTFAELVARGGADVSCIEPDRQLRLILQRKGFEVFEAPSELPGGRQFDVIYSLNVLEHIDDDRAAVQEIADRVAPGGVLLIYVPAFAALYTSMDRRVGHLRRYRVHEVKDLVGEAGLVVITAKYVDCLGFAVTLAYRFLGDRAGAINPRALKLYDRLLFPLSCRLDWLFGRLFGKNVLVVARRPGRGAEVCDGPSSVHRG